MNFKKIVALTIVMNMVFIQAAFGLETPSDVLGKSYETAVSSLFDKGIITGDENGFFNPEQTLTRAQACIIVVKSMKPPISEVAGTATQEAFKSGFPDMSGYGWAEGYISYAVKKGVTKGYPNGTFKPGSKVTSNELVTMILRGAGYFDDSLEGEWPINYVNLADTLNLYTDLPGKDEMPQYATKWMAAQMDYNALPLIEKANPPVDKVIFGEPKSLPDFTQAKYISSGIFSQNLSNFGGMVLDDHIQVYTYGERKDYVEGMTLSAIKSDYITDSIFKYKSVVTSAQYILENNRITRILLPKDVGFTGSIYCVINGTVEGLQTLTAAREMDWMVVPGIKNLPVKQQYSDGVVFKLLALNGKIQSLEPISDMAYGYTTVNDYKINGPVMISSGDIGKWMEISSTATIYTIDTKDQNKYKVGSTASIKKGSQIKLFDVSNDGETKADIVIIKE